MAMHRTCFYILRQKITASQRGYKPSSSAASVELSQSTGVPVHLVIMTMHVKPFIVHLLSITLSLLLPQTSASSVLGFGRVGGRSHHRVILRIGLELIDRGHTFTLLISERDHEKLFPSMLDRAETRAVNIVTFAGPAPSPVSSQDLVPEDLHEVMGQLIILHHCITVLVMVPLAASLTLYMCKCLKLQTGDKYLHTVFFLQHLMALMGDNHLAPACDAAYHLHEDAAAMQHLANAGKY